VRVQTPDGTRLFVDQVGGGLRLVAGAYSEPTPLVIVHGGPGADHTAMRPFFSRLADSRPVVFFDQRGMGRSDHSTPDRWTLEQWTQDLRFLIGTLGLTRPYVLGQSFGGYVALLLASRHPELMAGLILSSSQARPDPRDAVARFEALGGSEAATVAARFFSEPTLALYEEFRRVCFPLYNTRPRDPALDAAQIDTPEVLVHFWAGEYRALDLTPVLSGVSVPTLVVAGDRDPIIPCERSRALADGLVKAATVEFELIVNAGHGPYRDHPEHYERALRRFLAEAGDRPTRDVRHDEAAPQPAGEVQT
jgi:pimeloyl-ACP methyl ester carboxylesterase